VRELVVILPDFLAISSDAWGTGARATGTDAAGAGVAAALPRLTQLEALLCRATHAPLPEGGWREWLRERLHGPAMTPAATVAAAWGLPQEPARQYWLATPVHLFAGLDSVRLHPQGLLRLTPSEQRQLAEQFARVFDDSPWRLHARDRRELVLAGPALAASGADPALLLGADPSAGLPRGVDAPALKRLAAEIELWLHEHPLNLERQRRSQLPVTALWLWGGTPTRPGHDATVHVPIEDKPPDLSALPRLLGEDTYAQALWRLPAARTWQRHGRRDAVVLRWVCDARGLQPLLAHLEARWWPAARAALSRRRLSALRIVTAERVHSLSFWSQARRWRRTQPWWQLL